MSNINSLFRTCIERKFLGATEYITFRDFADYVIQDDEQALSIARVMLDPSRMTAEGDALPYLYNESEPAFYEEFTVTDVVALRQQIAAFEQEESA